MSTAEGSAEALPIVVQKFGGSSVATVEKLKAVAQKIVDTRRAGFSVVAVVSAMGDTTDNLLSLAREVTADPSKRELDMLLSVGERTSMALLSIAIHDLGESAISFTGSQVGIVTNHSHSNARIIDVRPFRVQDELALGNIVIVAGYQGSSYKREITTLGRGGSDTTAVALAAALGAAHCDIYSDVDGIFTTNPRVVLDAQRLESIAYEEMQELARLGARVLNAQAVEFARRKQIAIHARSTFGTGSGTVITRPDGFPERALAELEADGARGVASMNDVLWIEASSAQATGVLEALASDAVIHAEWGEAGLRALVSTENVADASAFAAAQRASGVSVREGLGSVSVVGLGVGQRPAAITRAFGALASFAPVAVFASGASITALVAVADVDSATQQLHAEFGLSGT